MMPLLFTTIWLFLKLPLPVVFLSFPPAGGPRKEKHMFKHLTARYFGNDIRSVKVSYVVTKRQCIFTATTKHPSSINAAEDIVTQICQAENISPNTHRFFDLQTCRGYSSKEAGEYELDELLISINNEGGIEVKDWKVTSFALPTEEERFRPFIGEAKPKAF